MKNKIEEIHWNDHTGSIGWQDLDKVKNVPQIVCSVGTLLKEDKKTLTLGLTVDHSEGSVSGTITIMKNCIVKRKKHGTTK